MIRAVVFDVGNVVCRFTPERRLQGLAQHTGLEPDRIHEAIWTSGLDTRAEAGQLSPADLERALRVARDNRNDTVTLRATWSNAFIPDHAVCELVGRLDRPAFAFTNNGPMFTDCLAHELIDVAGLFQRVICSWQLRARKPDPAAFERLCADLQQPPEELLFIDDDSNNTASARSVGLAAITFTNAEQLTVELHQLQGLYR
jgi:putative hydrolase of the HAD superfamily